MLGVKWCRSLGAEESPGFSRSLLPHLLPSRRGPARIDRPLPFSLQAICGWARVQATVPAVCRDLATPNRQCASPSPIASDSGREVVLELPLSTKKDANLSRTPVRAATCPCRGDRSPMTLRCLEPSGNGAEGTRSQWETAAPVEEPSPEAARLAKALRELSQTGREPAAATRAGGAASLTARLGPPGRKRRLRVTPDGSGRDP